MEMPQKRNENQGYEVPRNRGFRRSSGFSQLNLQDSNGARLQRVVVVGSILTEHDPIQDIDAGVQLERSPEGQVQPAHDLDVLKSLKGKSPLLKIHLWDDTLTGL
jgi:hypothetical protein